jgi:mucosa-associated lymphoid tissue lymphoma translocation protein 1
MISQPPDNTVTRLGDPIHLNCTAEGHPAPTYEWYKDGVLIPDEIESVLYIPEPSPEDRGNYSCKAINSQGETDQSSPAKLDIAGIYYSFKFTTILAANEVPEANFDQILEPSEPTALHPL